MESLLPCTCHGGDLVPYCPQHTPLPSEALVYKDPPGRHSIALVDSRSWIEVWDAEGGGDRTELHRPVIVTSVGYVDEPHMVEGAPWPLAVRRLLYGTTANVEDVLARLEARWRP